MLAGTAHAQQGRHARRLLIFFSPNGTIHRHWRPRGEGSNYSFPPGSILEGLSRHREDLLVIEGLNFLTGNNHEGGMAAMLTNRGNGNTETRGMSLDQYVASRIGGNDRFSSLEFGVLTDPWGGNVQTRMSYSGPGQLVHPDSDPLRAFGRMFGDLAGNGNDRDVMLSRRRSIIDLASADLTDLHRRIGRQEQIKLERHLESLRSVEQGLFAEGNEGDGCVAPAQPERLNKNTYANGPALTRSQMDLAVASLACGLTKVASIQFSHTVSPVVFSWAGNVDGHHSLSHADNGQRDKIGQFVAAERWCADQFAYLLDRMKATPSPDGDGSLLDDTVVLWAKELGDSRAHSCNSVPFVVAGGGAALRTGRYLNAGGVSHSKLLVSICHALGLDNQTFGDPATGAGGLPGLA